ncbi:hypothetical protein N7539_002128 [Penicillium diatomitis]|uniref:Uncharacterized protein n=1 Tax=Penicillium diatomitis TaxID=2819901 RepID=A0A9W9XI30_9EURO|nr:uncharacterized protein N7539_002128 [Penicillium diatomitis]KAJ5493382.1 hypothetical protein N7539_002128 [Penicillium diatomitis]
MASLKKVRKLTDVHVGQSAAMHLPSNAPCLTTHEVVAYAILEHDLLSIWETICAVKKGVVW